MSVHACTNMYIITMYMTYYFPTALQIKTEPVKSVSYTEYRPTYKHVSLCYNLYCNNYSTIPINVTLSEQMLRIILGYMSIVKTSK